MIDPNIHTDSRGGIDGPIQHISCFIRNEKITFAEGITDSQRNSTFFVSEFSKLADVLPTLHLQ